MGIKTALQQDNPSEAGQKQGRTQGTSVVLRC